MGSRQLLRGPGVAAPSADHGLGSLCLQERLSSPPAVAVPGGAGLGSSAHSLRLQAGVQGSAPASRAVRVFLCLPVTACPQEG